MFNLLMCDDYGRVKFICERFNIPKASLYRHFAVFKEIMCKGAGRPCLTEEQRKIKNLEAQIDALKEENRNLCNALHQERLKFSNAVKKLTFQLIGIGLSGRKIAWILQSAMEVRANHTDILKKAQQYATKATTFMEEYFHAQAVTTAIDEVFIEGLPVFIAVSPTSLLICNAGVYENCTEPNWTQFLGEMVNLEQTTSDRGVGIMSAVKKLEDHSHQSDIFHFKHLMQKELRKLEASTYSLINKEYMATIKLQKYKKSGKNVQAAAAGLRRAREKCTAAIDLFDSLEQAVKMTFEALHLSKGMTFNDAIQAREMLDFVREWILHVYPQWRKIANALRDQNLLEYMNLSHEAIKEIEVKTNNYLDREYILAALTQLWEQQSQRRYRGTCVVIPESVEDDLRRCCGNLDEVKRELFSVLESIPRASSSVECINSMIGFFRYGKKRFNDDFINLVSVVHNLSPFLDGKRKGRSPAEIEGVKISFMDIYELFEVV